MMPKDPKHVYVLQKINVGYYGEGEELIGLYRTYDAARNIFWHQDKDAAEIPDHLAWPDDRNTYFMNGFRAMARKEQGREISYDTDEPDWCISKLEIYE
jgi:hypothetical protein